MHLVVISGCSGGGKTALIEELASRGHAVVAEPGRRVIAAERNSGGRGMPWDDSARFAHLAFWMSVGDHGAAIENPTFFDRSALDQAAWFLRENHVPPGPIPYYFEQVFVTPPWLEIFEKDHERRHDFEDAVVEYDDLMRRLPDWGYVCRILPKTSVSARADWLLAELCLDEAAA